MLTQICSWVTCILPAHTTPAIWITCTCIVPAHTDMQFSYTYITGTYHSVICSSIRCWSVSRQNGRREPLQCSWWALAFRMERTYSLWHVWRWLAWPTNFLRYLMERDTSSHYTVIPLYNRYILSRVSSGFFGGEGEEVCRALPQRHAWVWDCTNFNLCMSTSFRGGGGGDWGWGGKIPAPSPPSVWNRDPSSHTGLSGSCLYVLCIKFLVYILVLGGLAGCLSFLLIFSYTHFSRIPSSSESWLSTLHVYWLSGTWAMYMYIPCSSGVGAVWSMTCRSCLSG